MAYGYIGSMKAKPGKRDEVVAILTAGIDNAKKAGCTLSVIAAAENDADTIWVTEVWESKEKHQASLELPETAEAIAKTGELLSGEFTTHELSVAGGVGV